MQPRPPTPPVGIEISSLEARFAPEAPTLLEHPDYLEVRTPPFVADVKVHCDADLEGAWSVGLVQAVRAFDLQLTYSDGGRANWELPFTPVSDSAGPFPWYDAAARRTRCDGAATLRLIDGLQTRATWTPAAEAVELVAISSSKLSAFERKQAFRVWLIAVHERTGEVHVLRTFDWSVHLRVAVSVDRALGDRAKVGHWQAVSAPPATQAATGASVPARVLVAPRANDLQQLWWTAPNGTRTLLRPHPWTPR